MDREKIIELFRTGMHYPPGKRRFWLSRCFEITVREDSVVEIDEHEGFSTEDSPGEASLREGSPPRRSSKTGMFHVGRSILDLKDGKVVEQSGLGWNENPAKPKKA